MTHPPRRTSMTLRRAVPAAVVLLALAGCADSGTDATSDPTPTSAGDPTTSSTADPTTDPTDDPTTADPTADPTSGTHEHPTGADDVVLQMGHQGRGDRLPADRLALLPEEHQTLGRVEILGTQCERAAAAARRLQV